MKQSRYRVDLSGVGVLDVHATTWLQAQQMLKSEYGWHQVQLIEEGDSSLDKPTIKRVLTH